MFVFFTFLFMGVVNVNATTMIDEVNITGVVEPVEGSNPNHSPDLLRANDGEGMDFVVLDSKDNGFVANKTNGSLMDYMTPFVEGQSIYFRLSLEVRSGYAFGNSVNIKYKNNTISSDNIVFNGAVYTVYIPFTVEPLVYNLSAGVNLSSKNLDEFIFEIDANYSLFGTNGKVYVDNNEVDAINYTVTEGSTIITLKEDYVSSLPKGVHSLKIEFSNGGETETNFIIERQVTPVNNPEDTTPPEEEIPNSPIVENPKTGDNIALSIVLGTISLVGLTGATISTKKRFN